MFLINSRLGHFTASRREVGNPFSRSYGVILPSSLATDHSSTCGYSPRLPESVYGTGCHSRLFLGEDSDNYHLARRLGVLSPPARGGGVQRTIPSVRVSLPSPFPLSEGRYGNINPFAIDYAVRLRLRPRLTLIRLALIRKP